MKRYLTVFLVLLMIVALACNEETPPVEKEEVIETQGSYKTIAVLDELKELAGKKVRITGTVSNEPWQHLMAAPDSFPVSTYFDVGKLQTVVYSTEPLACPNCKCKIEIQGEVLKVQGKGKGSKADEDYVEYHIVADSWRCLTETKEKSEGE